MIIGCHRLIAPIAVDMGYPLVVKTPGKYDMMIADTNPHPKNQIS